MLVDRFVNERLCQVGTYQTSGLKTPLTSLGLASVAFKGAPQGRRGSSPASCTLRGEGEVEEAGGAVDCELRFLRAVVVIAILRAEKVNGRI